MINSIKSKYYGFWAAVAVGLFSNSAWAADVDLKTTATGLTTGLTSMLTGIGLAIATVAVFVFGYQVSFGGKSPAQAAPVLIGGVIIGGAAVLAKALTGLS